MNQRTTSFSVLFAKQQWCNRAKAHATTSQTSRWYKTILGATGVHIVSIDRRTMTEALLWCGKQSANEQHVTKAQCINLYMYAC